MRDHQRQFPLAGNLAFARGVLLLDDAAAEHPWIVAGTGGDQYFSRDTAAAFSGRAGLYLRTRSVAFAEDDYLTIVRTFSYPVSGLLVARARLRLPVADSPKTCHITLVAANGIRAYYGRLRLTPATPTVEYYDSGGTPTAVADLASSPASGGWTQIELALDAKTNNYLSAALNGKAASLAGLGLWNTGADTTYWGGLMIGITAPATGPAGLHVTDISVTEYLDL